MKKRPSKYWVIFVFLLTSLAAASAFTVSAFAARVMENYPVVKLQSLDKATARTMTFDARVGGTVKFGQLFIRVQACRKAPPVELPEAAAFLQIWEVNQEEQPHWIFSGWMFSSSPGLSSMDHPIYDVWVLDCMESGRTASAEAKDAEKTIPPEPLPAPEEAAPEEAPPAKEAD
jgi:hypothetical protein